MQPGGPPRGGNSAIAGDLLAADPQAGLAAETAVLNAEVAFADNDIDQARALAESALASPQASPQIRCHALELLGRVLRGKDLDAARGAFEQALATADAAGLRRVAAACSASARHH